MSQEITISYCGMQGVGCSVLTILQSAFRHLPEIGPERRQTAQNLRVEYRAIAQQSGRDFEHGEPLEALCLRQREPDAALRITLDRGDQIAS